MTVPSPRRHGTTRRERERWSSEETSHRVLAWLAAHADDDDEISAGHRQIAEDLGLGDRTAARALTRLLDHNEVVLVRRGTGHPFASRYRLVEAHDPAHTPVA